MQTSYSKNSLYIQCPQAWKFSYIDKLESPNQGASLFFGSAIDAAVTEMLEGKPQTTWEHTFKDKWKTAFNFGTRTVVFDNDDIVYSNKDFDEYVLEPKDHVTMETWAAALNLALPAGPTLSAQVVELYKEISKIKKNPYLKTTPQQMKYWSRSSWLSMKRKGLILLDSFHTQFYPRIERVISTQERASIKDEATGDSIVGFIDMVLKLKDQPDPIIFDLKTAARPYSLEDIELTQQLTLYAAMKGKDYNTDKVGYVVLCKEIPKESVSTCQTCGHKKNGRHMTCDALKTDGTRCGGAWLETKKCKPEVQVLIRSKTQAQQDALLTDIGNIVTCMKHELVYKNPDKCNNFFGSRCPYYNACHNNDFSGLVKKK